MGSDPIILGTLKSAHSNRLLRRQGDFAEPVELSLSLVDRRLVAIPYYATCPVLKQSFRRGISDPTGTTCHQCSLSL